MYGFQPKHARGKPAQALADGGLVHSITGMLGMRKRTPEEMLAADAKVQERNLEAAARVAARAKPAQQAAPAEEKAVSSYAGMSAMQRRENELGLKDGGIVGGFKPGGLIRGPGTGTSDSIKTEKRPGTFIMPADSTKAIGPEALEELGEPEEMSEEAEGMEGRSSAGDDDAVPVALSNGEFEFTPEQVQALGEAVLTVMRNATHQPAGEQGEAPTGKGFTPHQFFSGGGTVKPRGFVVGKGTGTSDSIPARLSNGEYVLPADTVKAVGVEALDSLRAATHTPVKHEQAKAAHGFFAGGTPGGLDEEKLKNSFGDAAAVARDSSVAQVGGLANNGGADASRFAQVPAPIGTQPNRPPEPAAPVQAAPAPAAKDPLDGGAVFGFYPQLAGGQRTTYATDAKLRTGVQASGPSTFAPATPSERTIIGGGNGQRMNAAQDPRSLTYGATAGNDTEAPVAPAAPNPTDQRIAAGAQQAPAAATQPASAMVAPGAYRNAPGQYSDNAAGMGFAPGFTGQPNAQNMAAADALVARQTPAGFQPAGSQLAGVQAPVVRNSTNDWAARKALANAETAASSITNTRRWGGKGAESSPDVQAYQAMLRNDLALQQAQPGMDKAAMDGNTALQREGIQQAGATGRTAMQEQGATAREAGRTALAGEEMGLKRTAAGFQTRALQRVENLQTRYEAEKDPAKRSELARQLREIQGKEQPSEWGIQVTPATKNADGSTTEGSVIRYNKATGQAERVDTGANRNSAPYPDGTRLNGKDGKAYIVRNGVQVPA